MNKAQQIIQEALEVAMVETPKTFVDKLFHREPSFSKLKSSGIRYLTDRLIKAEEAKMEAEYKRDEVIKEALRVIGQFDPKEQIAFYNKFN